MNIQKVEWAYEFASSSYECKRYPYSLNKYHAWEEQSSD